MSKFNLLESKISQDLSSDTVIPKVGVKSEFFIGFNSIQPLVLKSIGTYLIVKSDAPPFLPHVQKDSRSGGGDLFQGEIQLFAAIATEAS